MLAAVTPDMFATDLAEHLVRKHVPFRETHHIAGRVVALAESKGVPMNELSAQQLWDIDSRFGDDVHRVFEAERAVEHKSASGGTSRSAVMEQIKTLKALTSGK